MPDSYVWRYTIDRAEWLEFGRREIADSPWIEREARMRRRVSLRRSIAWIAASPIVVYFVIRSSIDDPQTRVLGTVLGGVLLAGGMLWYYAQLGLHRKPLVQHLYAQLMSSELFKSGASIVMAIDADGVRWQFDEQSGTVPWKDISDVSRRHGFVILNLSTLLGVPEHAIGDQSTVMEAIDTLRRWQQEGQRPLEERIAEYLKDRDLPCPACSYNLRGARAALCPECGTALAMGSLMSQAEKQATREADQLLRGKSL